MKQCIEAGCREKSFALGFCRHHYYMFKRYDVTKHTRIELSCSVKDCKNAYYAKGLCRKHYYQERYGPRRKYASNRTCEQDGCARKHYARGLCKSHYNKFLMNRGKVDV